MLTVLHPFEKQGPCSGVTSKSARPFAKINHPAKVTITGKLTAGLDIVPEYDCESRRETETRIDEHDRAIGNRSHYQCVARVPEGRLRPGLSTNRRAAQGKW